MTACSATLTLFSPLYSEFCSNEEKDKWWGVFSWKLWSCWDGNPSHPALSSVGLVARGARWSCPDVRLLVIYNYSLSICNPTWFTSQTRSLALSLSPSPAQSFCIFSDHFSSSSFPPPLAPRNFPGFKSPLQYNSFTTQSR